MKRFIRRTLAITLCMMMAFVCGSAIGTFLGFGLGSTAAYAADDEYTYVITVNAGKEGKFNGGKTTVKSGQLNYGQSYTINVNDLGLTVNDPDTYYVRGLTISGHDNDELSSRLYQRYTFDVTEDQSYSVAYGVKGNMVAYTVRYVDENGNALHEAETFYGMPGDYPVVSYQYVEGYLPDAYNKGKTLSSNEAENVFTFTYYTNAAAGGDNNGGNNGGNDGNNGGGGAANAGGGNAGAGAANAGNGPANFVDLDNNQTPLAGGSGDGTGNGGTTDIDDNNPPKAGVFDNINPMLLILGGGGLVVVLAIIAFLFARRRNQEAEELAEELGIEDTEEYQQVKDMYIDPDETDGTKK